MEKVLLLHGYNGITPVFSWLKQEIEKLGYIVVMPSLPTEKNVRYNIWKEEFEKIKEDLDDNLIVISHSAGNPFIIKYFSKSKLNIRLYIGLAGFSDIFITANRKDLDEAVADLVPSKEEIEYFKNNIDIKYCVYSNNDHIIPLDILKKHVSNIKGIDYMIPNVGHMGRKSNLQQLPQVIEIIKNGAITKGV